MGAAVAGESRDSKEAVCAASKPYESDNRVLELFGQIVCPDIFCPLLSSDHFAWVQQWRAKAGRAKKLYVQLASLMKERSVPAQRFTVEREGVQLGHGIRAQLGSFMSNMQVL